MVLQLSFDEGTFAGKTIRTTDDHYASAYDIMRVSGVGRDASQQWLLIKDRIDEENRKIFKFKGAGQRDTPVLNGKGVVQMLFLLPGPKARKFVAEAAEILVRYLGKNRFLLLRFSTSTFY